MTFSCPNFDTESFSCRLLAELCVPGRPGCIQENSATYSEDVETRIAKAEQRVARHGVKNKRRQRWRD